MRYAHKTYTQGTEAWINESRGYVPSQIDDFILGVEIVETNDPNALTFDARDGDVTNAEHVWNGSLSINVFDLSLTSGLSFQLEAFTDAMPAMPYVLPILAELEHVETIEDAIRVLETHGFVPSAYHKRAEGRRWRESREPADL